MSASVTSPWIRLGWHGAICENCPPDLSHGWRDVGERGRWADEHEAEAGHAVLRLDPED